MKPVKYHPEARAEAIEAALFYDERQEGLGDRFLAAVEDCQRFIQDHPALGTPAAHGTRRHLVRRFPFAMVYRDDEDHIFVAAVAHLSRKPGYWAQRV